MAISDTFRRFLTCESGATAIEYGLMASLIGAAVIGGAGYAGAEVSNKFYSLGFLFEDAPYQPRGAGPGGGGKG